jgi:hypothetical protein
LKITRVHAVALNLRVEERLREGAKRPTTRGAGKG